MKKRNIYKLTCLVAILITAIVAVSCTKRNLEIRPGMVEVAFEWPEGVQPAAAHLHFYREDGSLHEIHEGLTGSSHSFSLPEGNYMLITHNEDAGHVYYDNIENYHQAVVSATTPEGDEPSEGCLLAEPQSVYGIGCHDEGTAFGVRSGDTTCLRVKPVRLTKKIWIHFTTKGLENMVSLGGTLNGVSPSVLLCTCTCVPMSCRMAFGAERSAGRAASSDWQASLELFDLLTRADSPEGTNTMDIVSETTGGRRYETTVDITPTLQAIIQDNGGELPIDIAVEISLSANSLGVLMATVSPWVEVDGGGGEI